MEGHRKRKPFSDITNDYDLIPTSTLRKLVAATTNPRSSSKPPLSILKSGSVSSNQRVCGESSNRSDASIGSSSVGGACDSRTVQFRTPPFAISSVTPLGGEKSKDVSYNRKQTNKNKTKGTEDANVVASPTSAGKKKPKENATDVPLSSSPFENRIGSKQKEIWKSGSLFERQNQKGTTGHNLFSDLGELAKDYSKSSPSSHNNLYEKTEKGKAVLNTSGPVMGKQDGMAKTIVDHSSHSREKTIEDKKAAAKHFVSRNEAEKAILKHLGILAVKTKDTRKEDVNPSSGCLVTTTIEKGKTLHPVGSFIEKSREKAKAIMQSSDDVEVTKAKELSAVESLNCQPLKRSYGRRRTDAGAASCPPMMKTKKFQSNLDADDIKSSKSRTDAQPKLKKKRSRIKETNELPQDFVEKQRAYFKEVDEFELPEEEVSADELD